MIVYRVTNLINNTIYIGQTVHSLKKRQSGHISKSRHGSNYLFHKALRKYGIDNFSWEVVGTVSSPDLLDQLEIDTIKYHRKQDDKLYNLTNGGNSDRTDRKSRCRAKSLEHRAKIAAALQGRKKTQPVSEETRRRISVALTGRKLSEEHKQNLRKSHSSRPRGPMSKEHKDKISVGNGGRSFSVYKDGKLVAQYINQSECARDLGLKTPCICRCLKALAGHRPPTHKGYVFIYNQD